jgi:hypothetical protein
MARDFYYKTGGPTSCLQLTTDKTIPDVLKRAITLMIFSRDPEIRNFNGQSVVLAFPKANDGGFGAINFNLIQAAKRIEELLRAANPEVSNVYFDSESNGTTLSVTLNVVTDSNTQTAVVYNP